MIMLISMIIIIVVVIRITTIITIAGVIIIIIIIIIIMIIIMIIIICIMLCYTISLFVGDSPVLHHAQVACRQRNPYQSLPSFQRLVSVRKSDRPYQSCPAWFPSERATVLPSAEDLLEQSAWREEREDPEGSTGVGRLMLPWYRPPTSHEVPTPALVV